MRTALLLSLMLSSTAMAQTTVKSLDGVRDAFQTNDARRMFDAEMAGKSPGDVLGLNLPAVLTENTILEQLAPGQDASRLVLAGARPWGFRPNSFVAIVCLAETADAARKARQNKDRQCEDLGGQGNGRKVWFGVLESINGAAPRLVARTDGPVSLQTDWSGSNIDAPADIDETPQGSAQQALPTHWKRFDLARYEVRPGDIAFGVRAGWSEGYSGGGAGFEALYLFKIDGPTLRPIFARPMSFSKMIAGDWNRDGTRQHEVSDAANLLIMQPDKTDGYFDILLRQQKGDWRRTLKWSAAKRVYE